MGIDYVIDLDCEPKQALTTEGIVNLVKARSRAEAILEMARADGDTRPPSEITFKVALNRQGKVETQDVSVQALLDQAGALEQHRNRCESCPANRDNPKGFGCYDSISYPIEPDTEAFLLARLPDKLESAAGYMFSSAVRDFGWDGAQAADMRSQGETFFRLRRPLHRQWPELSISGDQVFHMMFHVGHIGTSHALMLALFFGFVTMGDEEGGFERAQNVPLESGNSRQMLELLNTLAFCAGNKLDLLVDG
jgi:hypothetical protein